MNVPLGPSKGFKATVQAKRNHVTVVSERMDPRHRPYYWIEEGENHWESQDHSDYQAVSDGYVSITPLQPDMTAHERVRLPGAAVAVAPRSPCSAEAGRVERPPGRLVAFFVVLLLVLGLRHVLVALHELGPRPAPS